jgi:CRP-like cAMP-binding protein
VCKAVAETARREIIEEIETEAWTCAWGVMQTETCRNRPRNRLLSRLPDADFGRLAPHLRTLSLTNKLVLQRPNEQINEIVFPEGGVVSVTTMMRDGSAVEVATIGAEGLVGINAFLGGATSNSESMVQVPGATAVVLPVAVFRREVEQAGAFRERVQRYSQGLIGLMMQSAACLGLHSVETRCCRWLSMAHDRAERKAFQLSQEFLAMMLGSSRQTVNVVASALQKDGIISYAYGRVNVLDRPRLEQGACECYRTVEDLFAQLEL